MTKISLISSDDVCFIVDKDILVYSEFINNMLVDMSEEDIKHDNIICVQNVNFYYLKHIIDFCTHLHSEKNKWYKIPKPLPDISKIKDIPIVFTTSENIDEKNKYFEDGQECTDKMITNMPDFYVNFIKRFKFKELNELCEKSTYMIIPQLTELICASLACIIKSTTIEGMDGLIAENSYLNDY
jgi:hypothetical protein